MDLDLDAVECRVLGCLIEKQRTTPDAYPLSLNALRLACNQSTNRDPVVAFDEDIIRTALQRLYKRGYSRLASSHSSRTAKYRHLLDEALKIDPADQAVLAVLLLRGPQTPGELKQRTERMEPMSLEELHDVLTRMIDARPRRPARAPSGPEGGALPPPALRGPRGRSDGRVRRRGAGRGRRPAAAATRRALRAASSAS